MGIACAGNEVPMKPFLSILIPTYNRAAMTIEAVKSVGNNPEVEIIVTDDGSNSTEHTKLRDGLKKCGIFPILTYNEDNIGMTRNFNRCMQYASGEWFGLIGSDDYYKPGAIDRAVTVLHKLPPSLVVYSRDSKGWRTTPGNEAVRNLQLPSGSGNFWHRSIYEDVGGFDERLHFSPDGEYWFRIATKYPVVGVPEKYSVYRKHGANLMYETWRKPDFLKQIKLITRLNMVHRGDDTTDLDLVVANEGKAVWDTIYYILRVTAKKPDKHDIFDIYIEKAKSMAFTKDRLGILEGLIRERNKK
jgi:glycosyltransferase involved in cell wall biosynthesis